MTIKQKHPNHKGATVFVTSAYEDPEPLAEFLRNASLDRFNKHQLTDDPAAADLILFVENSHYHHDYFFGRLKRHPLVKQYPGKVFMYNPHDMPWFVLPGLYTCLSTPLFEPGCMTACPYIETINHYVHCDFAKAPTFLFSFYGMPQSAPRRAVMQLKHERGEIIASHLDMYGQGKAQSPQMRYADLLTDSKFVLCPKGIGPSSIRLFETMKAGRVPVIISDDWVRPPGPRWDDLAVFVPEDQVARIPQILEQEEANWEQKARLARKAWEDYFAPEAIFNYFIDNLVQLQQGSLKLSPSMMVRHSAAFLRYSFRKLVIQRVKSVLKRVPAPK